MATIVTNAYIVIEREVEQGRCCRRRGRIMKKHLQNYQLYLLVLPALGYVVIFQYIPMIGLQMAFKDYNVMAGIWGSEWVGLKHFIRFFELPNFWPLIRNTLGISLYQLAVGFPVPIALALMINELAAERFKKTVQMVTYAPHFISTVALAGMLYLFLHADHGFVNHLIAALGGPRIEFLSRSEWFKTVFVFSGIWQDMGWGTIIYLAALAGIDPQLIESARIDGANRLQKIRHIDLPGIMPAIVILLILNTGNLMSIGFEKVLLLQNQLNMEASDVISTYVYRIGLVGGQFSFTAAIGMFNSVVNLILLVAVNQFARRRSEAGLW